MISEVSWEHLVLGGSIRAVSVSGEVSEASIRGWSWVKVHWIPKEIMWMCMHYCNSKENYFFSNGHESSVLSSFVRGWSILIVIQLSWKIAYVFWGWVFDYIRFRTLRRGVKNHFDVCKNRLWKEGGGYYSLPKMSIKKGHPLISVTSFQSVSKEWLTE